MKRHVLATLAAVVVFALIAAAEALPGKRIELATTDGVTVVGTYTQAAKPSGRALILLHMLDRNRADWAPFVHAAIARGYTTLAIDLRGHGESTAGPDGRVLNWKNFQADDFLGTVRDIQAAREFLLKEQAVDPAKIAIVGASIGANLAVTFAAEYPQDIRAVALLSPGDNYRGVNIKKAVRDYPGRMLFYAAPGDDYAFKSSRSLAESAGERAEFNPMKGAVHGTRAFETEPEIITRVLDWLDRQL